MTAFIKVTRETLDRLGTDKGAYILALRLERHVDVGLRGKASRRLSPGCYYYIGSAQGGGGIRSRLRRHFRRDKKIHWHIDQLTTQATEMSAFAVLDGDECALVDSLRGTGHFVNIFPGFGSSDCRQCTSHLLMPSGPGYKGVLEALSA